MDHASQQPAPDAEDPVNPTHENDSDEILTQGGLSTQVNRKRAALPSHYLQFTQIEQQRLRDLGEVHRFFFRLG